MNSNQIVLMMMLAFVVKHYFADFPFQTPYMLKKGSNGTAWILPLFSHSSVHALFSVFILIGFGYAQFAWLAGVELVIHFIIDRIKATYKLPQGQWVGAEKYENLGKYYRAFGKDQMAHYITYVVMLLIVFN